MRRILVPLLCHSVPTVKVGYATEQAEAKQLFQSEGPFPSEAERRRRLASRMKMTKEKQKPAWQRNW